MLAEILPAACSPLFLDSAPILYFLEGHACHRPVLEALFERVQAREILAVTSYLSLTECLLGQPRLADECTRLFARRPNTLLLPIDRNILRRAGRLRARYGLPQGDALQLAAAMDAGCRAFLTNDRRLAAVGEMPVLVLDDLGAHG